VDHLNIDAYIRSEDPPICAIGRDAVNGGQRIRGDHRAPPSDHIAVVVVMRRLYENQLEVPIGQAKPASFRLGDAGLVPRPPPQVRYDLSRETRQSTETPALPKKARGDKLVCIGARTAAPHSAVKSPWIRVRLLRQVGQL